MRRKLRMVQRRKSSRYLACLAVVLGAVLAPLPSYAQSGNETTGGPSEVVVIVPDLTITGQPEPERVVINVPEITIVGAPDLDRVVIDVPDLVIVGAPDPTRITIDVPDLTIVGAPDEDDTSDPDAPDNRLTDLTVTPSQTTTGSTTTDVPDTNAQAQDWCFGDYTSHIGRGIGTAAGIVMPFGKNLIAPAQVDLISCGDALEVQVQGQTVSLTRASASRLYSGTIDFGDGAMRTLILNCDEDLNLRGKLVTADSNLSIERPVWMMRSNSDSAALANCDLPD